MMPNRLLVWLTNGSAMTPSPREPSLRDTAQDGREGETSLAKNEATACETCPADEAFVRAFNDLLVTTYRSIEGYEQAMLDAQGSEGLTISELHLVEAVGRVGRDCPAGATVSRVAEALGVRVPTATTAVSRLVSKGMLVKERSAQDARIVNVRLTRAGEKAYRLHATFHRRMAQAVLADLSPAERDALVGGIHRLEAFFSAPLPPRRDGADVAPQTAPNQAQEV